MDLFICLSVFFTVSIVWGAITFILGQPGKSKFDNCTDIPWIISVVAFGALVTLVLADKGII